MSDFREIEIFPYRFQSQKLGYELACFRVFESRLSDSRKQEQPRRFERFVEWSKTGMERQSGQQNLTDRAQSHR